MRSFVLLFLASILAVAMAGTACGNQGLLGASRPKKFVGECNRSDSKGKRSSHNCVNAGGTKYLCVLSGQATCIEGSAKMKKLDMEGGECFL
ncbi:hypothetical protein CALVIDRAFT_535187 [Calocera viscosa TUFC12733]|uniref:Uncharacterized protein n=1 Tax=Calocera viscosa (strain TUFC12733) TaxID=1330018 RepID=A0A167P9A3_CALVF|nr:hypothetical protein CALVIDRAFT_535187 [Calocera viscosa TUFC12733]